jgi:hypothetical protein
VSLPRCGTAIGTGRRDVRGSRPWTVHSATGLR